MTYSLNDNLSVLVVEDDPVDYQLLQRALRDLPFLLSNVQTLSHALEKLNYDSFDVVLLDLSLPDSSGLLTIEAVTGTVSTPVVALSGAQDETTALQAVQRGYRDTDWKSSVSR